jgi:hypothetical protein
MQVLAIAEHLRLNEHSCDIHSRSPSCHPRISNENTASPSRMTRRNLSGVRHSKNRLRSVNPSLRLLQPNRTNYDKSPKRFPYRFCGMPSSPRTCLSQMSLEPAEDLYRLHMINLRVGVRKLSDLYSFRDPIRFQTGRAVWSIFALVKNWSCSVGKTVSCLGYWNYYRQKGRTSSRNRSSRFNPDQTDRHSGNNNPIDLDSVRSRVKVIPMDKDMGGYRVMARGGL